MSHWGKRVMRVSSVWAALASLALVGCASQPQASQGEAVASDVEQAAAVIAQAEATEASEPVATEPALTVVTTILPITQFTNAVAGDRATVVPLMPPNASPHDFQARPGDIATLAQADALVINGLEMELFLDDLIANAENPNLTIIDSSRGIEAVAFDARPDTHGHHDHGDDHDHDHDHHHDHDHDHGHSHSSLESMGLLASVDLGGLLLAHGDHSHDHDHDHDDDHSHDHGHSHGHSHGHVHGEFDPHIWLDPQRAMQQVENIRDGLIEIDPDGAEIYTANAAAFLAELNALDQEIETLLAPFAGQSFVVFHDFAFYFADRYNLNAEFLVSLPEANPTPEDVRRVMETVTAAGLSTIMTEPQAGGSNPFAALAGDLSVGVGVFDPLETASSEMGFAPEYYLMMMRKNASSLAEALTPTTALVAPALVSGR